MRSPLPSFPGCRVAQDSLDADPFKPQPNSPGKGMCPQILRRVITREKAGQKRESLTALFKIIVRQTFAGTGHWLRFHQPLICSLSPPPGLQATLLLNSVPGSSLWINHSGHHQLRFRDLSERQGVTLLLPLLPLFLCPLLIDLGFVSGPHTPTMAEGWNGLLHSLVLLRSFTLFCFKHHGLLPALGCRIRNH